MKLYTLIHELKLGTVAKKELEDVLSLPEVQAVLGREEHATIEKRKMLIADLAELPRKYAKRKQEAEAIIRDTVRRVESLEENLKKTRDDLHLSRAAAGAIEAHQQRETWDLQAELRDGSDPRLADFWRLLDQLDGAVRVALSIWPEAGKKNFFGGREPTIIHSNVSDMEAARNTIADAKRDCETMGFQALTRQEISERLTRWTHKLEEPLAVFGLQPPGVDERGEVQMMPKVSNSDVIKHVSKAGDLAA